MPVRGVGPLNAPFAENRSCWARRLRFLYWCVQVHSLILLLVLRYLDLPSLRGCRPTSSRYIRVLTPKQDTVPTYSSFNIRRHQLDAHPTRGERLAACIGGMKLRPSLITPIFTVAHHSVSLRKRLVNPSQGGQGLPSGRPSSVSIINAARLCSAPVGGMLNSATVMAGINSPYPFWIDGC
jgi:hypothetical protein